MATAKSNLMILIILLFFISSFTGTGVTAENRYSRLRDSDIYMEFIDNFRFTGTQGRVELKVNNISFSNFNFSNSQHPNPIPAQTIPNTSLSNMTFFLSDKFLLFDFNWNESCFINNSHSKYKLYTLQPGLNSFDFIFQGFIQPGDYILYFQNCAGINDDDVHVSMNVESYMYNIRENEKDHIRDYLSPNKILVTKVFYPFFALVHFTLACVWAFHVTKLKKTSKKTMCWLLVLVPYLRAWSLILGMLHNLYIMKGGCADGWPSLLLSSASAFLGEPPVAILLILFSTGFVTVKLTLRLGDILFVSLEIFGQLFLLFINILLQFYWRDVLYLDPGIMTTFFSIAIGVLLQQKTVMFTLKFLLDVARGNFASVTCANHTPLSLLTFAEILKSIFSTYTNYSAFQCFVMAALEIFSSHLPLIVSLKELAAMVFYVKFASHVMTELWTLTISKDTRGNGIYLCRLQKKGAYAKDNDISKDNLLWAHYDIEKAEPLTPYDDGLIMSCLEREWDGI